jgi:hypothetical protein
LSNTDRSTAAVQGDDVYRGGLEITAGKSQTRARESPNRLSASEN